MPLVNVPGVGQVNFPDSMSQGQIISAIETDILPNYATQKPQAAPVAAPTQPEPTPGSQSFLRQVADVPLQSLKGNVTGVRMIADAFGADNPVSANLRGVEDYIGALMSAQSKQDAREVSRIMKAAEDAGVLENVKAGVKALTVAPVDLVANALGTAGPAILAGVGAMLLGAPAAVITGTGIGIGALTGAGNIKGTIYEEVKAALKDTDMSEAQAEARAVLAQEYGGKNLDMILAGTALGGLASSTGVEKGAAKLIANRILKKAAATEAADIAAAQAAKQGLIRRVTTEGVKEAIPEAVQAAQERIAGNIAQQREGFDVPTMRGAIGQAALEGLLGGITGGGLGTITGGGRQTSADQPRKSLVDLEKVRQEAAAAEPVPSSIPVQETPAATRPLPLDLKRVSQIEEDLVMSGVAPEAARSQAVAIATKEATDDAAAAAEEAGVRLEPARVDVQKTPAAPITAAAPTVTPTPTTEQVAAPAAPQAPQALTPEATAVLDKVEKEGPASVSTEELKKVAADNGITATKPSTIIVKLEEKKAEAAAVTPAAETITPAAEPTEAQNVIEAEAETEAVGQLEGGGYPEGVSVPLQKPAPEGGAVTEPVGGRVEAAGQPAPEVTVGAQPEPAPLAPTPAPHVESVGATVDTGEDPAKQNRSEARKIFSAAGFRGEELTGLLADVDENTDLDALRAEYPAIDKKGKATVSKSEYLEAAKISDTESVETTAKEEGVAPLDFDAVSSQVGSTSSKPDLAFERLKTGVAALRHIIKKGNPFESVLAARLLAYVNGVRIVVIQPGQPIPPNLSPDKFSESRAIYYEVPATGGKTIYIHGGKFPDGVQGINIRTILHELLHAATIQKLKAGAYRIDPNSNVTLITQDLINLMRHVGAEYKKLGKDLGIPEIAFRDVREFVTYGMTDPRMQAFMVHVKPPAGRARTAVSQFVSLIRALFGMGPKHQSAFADLISMTDELIGAKMTRAETRAIRKGVGPMVVEAAQEAEKALAKDAPLLNSGLNKESAERGGYSFIDDFMRARDAGERVSLLKTLILTAPEKFQRVSLSATAPQHIKQMFASVLPSIGDVSDALTRMDGKTDQLMKEASQVTEKWAAFIRKNPVGNNLLSDIMNASTIFGIDPSTEAGRAKSPELARAWKELGKYPGGYEIFNTVKRFNDNRFLMSQTALLRKVEDSLGKAPDTAGMTPAEAAKAVKDHNDNKTRIMAGIRLMYEKTKIKGPYFALSRFGPYYIRIGKGDDMIFDMSDSKYEHERKMQEYKRKGYEIEDHGMGVHKQRDFIQASSMMLRKSMDAVDAFAGKDGVKEELKDALYQAYLQTLPEMSMRKQFIHRKNTAGYNPDAFRSFVKSAYHSSTQLARMEFSTKALNAVAAARQAIRGDVPMKDVLSAAIDELDSRVVASLQRINVDNPLEQLADKAANLSFYYYLSSASSAMVQLFSVPTHSLSVLVSEYRKAGDAKILKLLAKNSALILGGPSSFSNNGTVTFPSFDNRVDRFEKIYNQAAETVRAARTAYVNGTLAANNMWKLDFNQVVEELGKDLKGKQQEMFDLRRAYEEGIDEHVFEATITSDFRRGTRAPSEKVANRNPFIKVADAASAGLFHAMEKNSREITYITAYQLGRAEGLTHQQAVLKARDLSFAALGNYGASQRIGLMNKPLLRLLLQFKRYPIEQVFYFGKNAFDIVANLKARALDRNATPEQKKEYEALAKAATIRFTGTLAMISTFAGVMGLPFPIVFAVQQVLMMMGHLGDDDEDKLMRRKPDLWLRQWMREKFKSRAVADSILYGPVTVGTNTNLHDRLKVDDLFFRDTSMEGRKTSQEFQEWLVAMMGPVVGMGVNGARALDLLQNGKTERAIETMMPSGIRQFMTAGRYATEGVKTPKGAQVFEKEEVGVTDIFKQMFGFAPYEIAIKTRDNIERKGIAIGVEAERTKLIRDYASALETESLDEVKVLDAIDKFNDTYPMHPILPSQLMSSINKRAKEEAQTERGLSVPKQYRPYLMPNE